MDVLQTPRQFGQTLTQRDLKDATRTTSIRLKRKKRDRTQKEEITPPEEKQQRKKHKNQKQSNIDPSSTEIVPFPTFETDTPAHVRHRKADLRTKKPHKKASNVPRSKRAAKSPQAKKQGTLASLPPARAAVFDIATYSSIQPKQDALWLSHSMEVTKSLLNSDARALYPTSSLAQLPPARSIYHNAMTDDDEAMGLYDHEAFTAETSPDHSDEYPISALSSLQTKTKRAKKRSKGKKTNRISSTKSQAREVPAPTLPTETGQSSSKTPKSPIIDGKTSTKMKPREEEDTETDEDAPARKVKSKPVKKEKKRKKKRAKLDIRMKL